ncbi:ABC transporter ATP-binding protein [Nocardia sp. NPDC050175]|uniref:ABC transporter ATP-binding protein n=1 Tax=Nocardia sp. NPDC050175 TaxID=3364317 RepID=UPI00378BA7A1
MTSTTTRYSTAGLLRRVRAEAGIGYRTLAVTAVLAALAASGRIVIPVTIQHALDHALLVQIDTRTRTSVITVAVAIGLAAVLSAMISSSLLNRYLVHTVENAVFDLRVRAFERILRTTPASAPAETQGSLVARVTNDLDVVTLFAQSGGITLVQNISQMLIALVVMLVYSWPLALIALAIGIGVPVLGRALQRVVARRFDAVRVAVAAVYSGLLEALVGIDTVRGYGIEARMRARVTRRIDAMCAAQERTLWPMGFNVSIGEAASGLITTAVLVLGVALGTGSLGWDPGLSAGDVVAFLFLATFFVRPLQFAVSSLADARNSEAGLRRVIEILDRPDGSVAMVTRDLPQGPPTVRLDGVSFCYVADRPVLRGVDIVLQPGEQVSVVGETGSGKTTFAKLVTRQLVPTSGRLTLWGVDLIDIADAALARRVAVVPQDAFLFDRTVFDNIALGRVGATRADVLDVLSALDLLDWIEGMPDGLDTVVGQRGESLSAGERQLVALARTALVNPDLLVLDEATSGVDSGTDVRVQQALNRLAAGRTTITIAHRMHSARTADRILVFHNGVVVEDGSHAQLLAVDGRYARLHRVWSQDSADRVRVP